KWIKENLKQIHFGFENREYDLSKPVGSDVGQLCPAADVTLIGSDEVFNVAEHRGKITVINFWGTWCGPCRLELPDFDKIATDYANDVNVLALHSDWRKEDAPEYIQTNFQNSNIIFGVDEGEAYYTLLGGEGSYPMTWILDEQGVVIAEYLGMIDYETLQGHIEDCLN
ncbi:MAG: TlpA family protein disulfide reductase, partial [Clostridia bacterium]|nr:TlpA family protein disulfide reductase [Clostridia bacterium]